MQNFLQNFCRDISPDICFLQDICFCNPRFRLQKLYGFRAKIHFLGLRRKNLWRNPIYLLRKSTLSNFVQKSSFGQTPLFLDLFQRKEFFSIDRANVDWRFFSNPKRLAIGFPMVARVGSLESSRNKRNRYTSFFLRSGNGMENIFVFPFFLDRKSHFGKEKNIYIQIFSKRQKDFEVGPPRPPPGLPRPLDSNSHQKNWWVPPSLQKVPTRNGEFWKEIFLPRYWRRIGWKDRSNFPPLSRSRIGKHSVVFQFLSPDLGRKFFLLELCMDRELVAKMGVADSDFLHSSAVLPDIWKEYVILSL